MSAPWTGSYRRQVGIGPHGFAQALVAVRRQHSHGHVDEQLVVGCTLNGVDRLDQGLPVANLLVLADRVGVRVGVLEVVLWWGGSTRRSGSTGTLGLPLRRVGRGGLGFPHVTDLVLWLLGPVVLDNVLGVLTVDEHGKHVEAVHQVPLSVDGMQDHGMAQVGGVW